MQRLLHRAGVGGADEAIAQILRDAGRDIRSVATHAFERIADSFALPVNRWLLHLLQQGGWLRSRPSGLRRIEYATTAEGRRLHDRIYLPCGMTDSYYDADSDLDGFGDVEVKAEKEVFTVKASAKSLKTPVKSMRLLVDGRPFMGKDGVRTFADGDPRLRRRSV